jgi:AraC-like DNA-binding protein
VNQLVRYAPLVNNLLVVSLAEEGGHGLVIERIVGEPLCLGKHANEFALANVVNTGRSLAGQAFAIERVWFAHPAPPGRSVEELARFFNTPRIEWDAGYNAVQVSASVLDLPVRTADSALYGFLEREAAERVRRLGAADPYDDVSQAIRKDLANGEPNIERVAKALSTSARSLQRRLEGNKTSFRERADEVRRSMAELYLEDHHRPVTEVAFLLGYSDARAFARAYKRWTGRTPGEARRA